MKNIQEMALFILANVACALVSIAAAVIIGMVILSTIQYAQDDISSLLFMIPLMGVTVYIHGRYIVKIGKAYWDMFHKCQ